MLMCLALTMLLALMRICSSGLMQILTRTLLLLLPLLTTLLLCERMGVKPDDPDRGPLSVLSVRRVSDTGGVF